MEASSSASTEASKNHSPRLERTTLYAPLAAYQQTKVEPSAYLRSVKAPPKSVTEAGLVSFLASVSSHHHLSKPSLHGKNTSARSMQEQDAKERLQQRTLNLVGRKYFGGAKRLAVETQKSRRKRKRKLSSAANQQAQSISPRVWEDQKGFLIELNQRWTQYAWNMLMHPAESTRDFAFHDLKFIHKVKLISKTMEWVGARVRLDECPSLREWVGFQGILVANQSCTWLVFPLEGTKLRKRLVTIPKLPSTALTALLPIQSCDGDSLPVEQSDKGSEPRQFLCLTLSQVRRSNERTTNTA